MILSLGMACPAILAGRELRQLILDVPNVPLLESESFSIELHGVHRLLARCARDWETLADAQVRWCRLDLVELSHQAGKSS